MIKKTNYSGKRGLQYRKAVPIALLFLQGNTLLAQTSSKTSEGVSILEILGYVAMISGVILLAWFIGAAQSKSSPNESQPKLHKHFDHPNDPHFRKLKKKTS